MKFNPKLKKTKVTKQKGVSAPANIANALGIKTGMSIQPMMLSKLLNHPNLGVSSTAKRLMGNMYQGNIWKQKREYQ